MPKHGKSDKIKNGNAIKGKGQVKQRWEIK
jgi:hypothetical protein